MRGVGDSFNLRMVQSKQQTSAHGETKTRFTALQQHRLLLDRPTLGADLVYLSSNSSLDLEHRLVCLSSSLATPTLAALSSVPFIKFVLTLGARLPLAHV